MWALMIVITVILLALIAWWYLSKAGKETEYAGATGSVTGVSDFVSNPSRYSVSVQTKSVLSPVPITQPSIEQGFIMASGPRFLSGAHVRIADKFDAVIFDGPLARWNATVAGRIVPSQDKLSKELIQYLYNFDPYELQDKQERVDMCRWLGAFYGETGYADPATGEYVTQSLQTRFKQHSNVTYATPHQLWPSKYHGMLTASRLNDRIAPGWATAYRSFDKLKAAAGLYCNGPKKKRADGKYYDLTEQANCRAIYESYYGSCIYQAAKLPESYCNK